MSTRFNVAFALLAASALALAGCSGSKSPASSDETPAEMVTLANAVCPVMGGKIDPAVTIQWNGKTVGFCCPECIAKFEALSDEEKEVKLTAAATGETDDPMHAHESGDADHAM